MEFANDQYIAPYIDYIPAVPSVAVSVTVMGHSTEDPFTVTQISTAVPSEAR